jgi:hypothetical protein
VFLWLGPRISYLHYYRDVWAPSLRESSEALPEFWSQITPAPDDVIAQIPATQYLPVALMPSLLASQEAGLPPLGFTPPVWTVESTAGLLATYLLSLAVGVMFGCFYVALIGQQVGEGRLELGRTILRLPGILLQVGLLMVILAIVFVVVMAPFALLAVALGLFTGREGMDITLGIGFVFVLWLSMFGVFTIHGMLMHGRRLVGALWDSIRVVQWNMSATLFLLIVVAILNWALQQLFRLSDLSTWITLVAIPAHAFAITALVAATFVFYKDRHRYWREMRDELLAELERRRAQDRSQPER